MSVCTRLFMCVLILWGADLPAQVAVIAHPSVPEESLGRAQLLDFYTGDRRTWNNGDPVVVIDLEPKTDIKETFYKYLGRSTSRMKSIWLKKKLSGEGGPPEALESEGAIVERVTSTPGAIGFIHAAKAQRGVKTLLIIPQE